MLGDEIGAEALLGQARRCYTEPDAAVRQMFGEEAVAQALRFDPSAAAPLIAELDQDRVATHVLRVRLALVDHDDHAAAALLADLPPATTRRTRVERGVLWRAQRACAATSNRPTATFARRSTPVSPSG